MENRSKMRGVALTVLILAFNAPTTAALARSSCEAQAHQKRIAGTVLGAVGGAIIGNQISHGGGTIIGGLAGGFAGNQLSKSHCEHHHYAEARARGGERPQAAQQAQAQAAGPSRCSMQDQPFYDAHGDLVHRQVQVCR